MPGKKVSGIKRHIAVDTQGLPHGIHVTTADVTDRAGALAMFDENRSDLNQVQKVLVYTGKPFAVAVQSLLGATVEVVKRNELHTFVVLPKRSVFAGWNADGRMVDGSSPLKAQAYGGGGQVRAEGGLEGCTEA